MTPQFPYPGSSRARNFSRLGTLIDPGLPKMEMQTGGSEREQLRLRILSDLRQCVCLQNAGGLFFFLSEDVCVKPAKHECLHVGHIGACHTFQLCRMTRTLRRTLTSLSLRIVIACCVSRKHPHPHTHTPLQYFFLATHQETILTCLTTHRPLFKCTNKYINKNIRHK